MKNPKNKVLPFPKSREEEFGISTIIAQIGKCLDRLFGIGIDRDRLVACSHGLGLWLPDGGTPQWWKTKNYIVIQYVNIIRCRPRPDYVCGNVPKSLARPD